jgi:hypothetical protein
MQLHMQPFELHATTNYIQLQVGWLQMKQFLSVNISWIHEHSIIVKQDWTYFSTALMNENTLNNP